MYNSRKLQYFYKRSGTNPIYFNIMFLHYFMILVWDIREKGIHITNIHILTSSFSCSVLLILECVLQVFQHKWHYFLHISYKKSKSIMLNLIKIVPERLYICLYIYNF